LLIHDDSYSQYYRREHARENWEIKNYIEGEKKEMVELWTSRGLDESTATDVIEKISKHQAFFADIMMKVTQAGACFVSHVLFSLVFFVLFSLFLRISFYFSSLLRTSSIFRTLTLTRSKLLPQAVLDF
jgi:hypothetical protein